MNGKSSRQRPSINSMMQKPASTTGSGSQDEPPNRPNNRAERARLTLRLDPDRHLKIRIAAAHMNLKLQDIMIQALDRYLAEVKSANPDTPCNCWAESIPVSMTAKDHWGV